MDDTRALNGLRFILALWVAVGHFIQMVGGIHTFSFPGARILLAAGAAVDGFIFISGFLMAYHYIARDTKEPMVAPQTKWLFWARRWVRLYPIYIIAITVAFYFYTETQYILLSLQDFFTNQQSDVLSKLLMPLYQAQWSQYITHLFFVHGFFATHESAILDPAWSLSLETQFYMVFPFVFVWLMQCWQRRILFATLLITLAGVMMPKLFGIFDNPGLWHTWGEPSMLPYRMPLFLLGMIAAVVFQRRCSTAYLALAAALILPTQLKLSTWVVLGILLMLYLPRLEAYLPKVGLWCIEYFSGIFICPLGKLGGLMCPTVCIFCTC